MEAMLILSRPIDETIGRKEAISMSRFMVLTIGRELWTFKSRPIVLTTGRKEPIVGIVPRIGLELWPGRVLLGKAGSLELPDMFSNYVM